MREHEFLAPVSRAPIAVVHFAIYFQASRGQTDRRRLLGSLAHGPANDSRAFHRVIVLLQELFVYQLKFCNWKGFGLRASDVPKRKVRHEQTMTAEEKAKAKQAEYERRLEEKRQKQREKVEKVRKQRQEQEDRRRGVSRGGRSDDPVADDEKKEGGEGGAMVAAAETAAGDTQALLSAEGEGGDSKAAKKLRKKAQKQAEKLLLKAEAVRQKNEKKEELLSKQKVPPRPMARRAPAHRHVRRHTRLRDRHLTRGRRNRA